MIKINLANSKVAAKSSSSADAAQLGVIDQNDLKVIRKTALTRALVLVLGPVALLAYEQQTIPALETQLRNKNQEYQDLSAKNQKALEAVEQIKKFKKEQEALQAQINSIESLKKDRLREVRMLDFIQKDLPENLWLTRMDMSEGRLSIQGLSTTDNQLTQFMDTLSRSAYLREVSLVRSGDFASPDMGNLKRFEISCQMEKVQ